jgi:hypothetical protein
LISASFFISWQAPKYSGKFIQQLYRYFKELIPQPFFIPGQAGHGGAWGKFTVTLCHSRMFPAACPAHAGGIQLYIPSLEAMTGI